MVLPCRSCSSEIARERRAPRQAIVDQAKAAGCVDCGIVNIDHPEIFDFDHTGDDKAAGVAAFMTKGTEADLVAEIAKCEVVCANCHRIRTKARPSATRGKSRV